jgi:hypothetical protein
MNGGAVCKAWQLELYTVRLPRHALAISWATRKHLSVRTLLLTTSSAFHGPRGWRRLGGIGHQGTDHPSCLLLVWLLIPTDVENAMHRHRRLRGKQEAGERRA